MVHTKRLYTALLVAALISYLLYRTQWPALRPGLMVLLAGQVVDALALLWRRSQTRPGAPSAEWLKAELRFTHQLARADTVFQAAGFLLLGYALWISSRNAWLALAIGVVYPVTSHFGIMRPRNAAIRRELEAKLPKLP